MKNFEGNFFSTPLPKFGHAPKKFFAQNYHVTHEFAREFNPDYEYEIHFSIELMVFDKLNNMSKKLKIEF